MNFLLIWIYFLVPLLQCKTIITPHTNNFTKTKEVFSSYFENVEKFDAHPSSCSWKNTVQYQGNAAPSPRVRVGASLPFNVVPSCHCKRATKQCYSNIQWTQLNRKGFQSPVTAYRLKFMRNENEPNHGVRCYRLPRTAREFNFTFQGFLVDGKSLDNVPFVLGAEPFHLGTQLPHYYIKCPIGVSVTPDLPHNVQLEEGDNYTFNCSYKGYPLPAPSEITWLHTAYPSLRRTIYGSEYTSYGKLLHVNEENIHVIKGDGFTSLTITKATQEHMGTYKCFIGSYFGPSFSDSSEGSIFKVRKPQYKVERLAPTTLLAVVAGILLLVVLIVPLLTYTMKGITQLRSRHMQLVETTHGGRRQSVYISHCTRCKKGEEKLVRFASHAEELYPNLSIVVDLTKQTEINHLGGLSQWVPEQMSKADKILVVLSREYLDVVEKVSENIGSTDTKDCKVAAEYRFIGNLLHEKMNVTDKVVVAWQSGGGTEDLDKVGKLPPLFQGRTCYQFPKTTASFRDRSLAKLLFHVRVDDAVWI